VCNVEKSVDKQLWNKTVLYLWHSIYVQLCSCDYKYWTVDFRLKGAVPGRKALPLFIQTGSSLSSSTFMWLYQKRCSCCQIRAFIRIPKIFLFHVIPSHSSCAQSPPFNFVPQSLSSGCMLLLFLCCLLYIPSIDYLVFLVSMYMVYSTFLLQRAEINQT
jgi:hypothetical protein